MPEFSRRNLIKSAVVAGVAGVTPIPATAAPDNATITSADIAASDHLTGWTTTDEERALMVRSLADKPKTLTALRASALAVDQEPATHFTPRTPGTAVPSGKNEVRLSRAPTPAYNGSPESLAFYTLTDLSRLVKAKKVTSVALTRMYLDRLKKYGPGLLCVISLVDETEALRLAALVRRQNPQSLEADQRVQRLLSRSRLRDRCGTRRFRYRHGNSGQHRLTLPYLRHDGSSPHLRTRLPPRCHAAVLDHGQDRPDLSRRRRLRPRSLPAWHDEYDALADIIINVEGAASFTRLRAEGGLERLAQQDVWNWPNSFRVAATIPAPDYVQALRIRTYLQHAMADSLRDFDAYLTIPRYGPSLLYTNLTGNPTVITRCGKTATGLPLSLEFTGPLYREDTILRLAHAYEQATPWHQQWPDNTGLPLAPPELERPG